jgi:surface protein
MFESCTAFDQPLHAWNVSNVTNMSSMFYYCPAFNQPLNDWNVSNVTNMEHMFFYCIKFNQPLNDWNVSNVTKMQYMFSGCVAFDQPLNAWNVSNVTTHMQHMFTDDCPIRDSYKPGAASEVTPTTALRQFYQAHHRQLPPTTLAEKCNQETVCPITYMSLKRLRDMKRLVVLDGRCYAFYAFIQGDPPLTNPFTRQPWSAQAKADIAAIRKYRGFLKEEYEGLPEKTPTRRTRRGRTARQRQQPTSTRKSATRKSRTP